MSQDLHDRLADLAEDAGASGPDASLPVAAMWERGRSRARRQRLVNGLLVLGVLAGLVGLGSTLVNGRSEAPVVSAESRLGMPDHVYSPDPWSRATAGEGNPSGRLVALLPGERSTLFSSDSGYWGITADGEYVFLDLPGFTTLDASPELSPDGRYVGYWVSKGSDLMGTATGYAVYDTETGDLRTWTPDYPKGIIADGIGFTAQHAFFGFAKVVEIDKTESSSIGVPTEVVSLDEWTRQRLGRKPRDLLLPLRGSSTITGFLADKGNGTVFVTGPHTWRPVGGPLTDGQDIVPSPDGSRVAAVRTATVRGGMYRCCTSGPILVSRIGVGRARVEHVPGGATYDQMIGWADDSHVLVLADGTSRVYRVDVETGERRVVSHLRGTAWFASTALGGPRLTLDEPGGVNQRLALGYLAVVLVFGSPLWLWLWRRVRGRV